MEKPIPENTSKNTHNVVADLLISEINDNDASVLDIPSGQGAFTKRLMDRGIKVYPGDIENILKLKNERFQLLDMNKELPFSDRFFDAVACIDGIEHLENPFLFIRESSRIIKRGGSIIISTPNINALRSRWRWFWTSHHNKNKVPLAENNPNASHHINLMSYQRLRYILHIEGFEIDRVKTNRVKPISWAYALFVPIAYLFTAYVYNREEKDPIQRKYNNKIIKTLFSKPLLFGETMIIRAKKT